MDFIELHNQLSGSDHAKYLNKCKKRSENSHFWVLNIPLWAQNSRYKDYFFSDYNGFGGE